MNKNAPETLPEPDAEASPFDLIGTIARDDFITAPPKTTAGEMITRFANQSAEAESHHLCVTDTFGRFRGFVSLRSCLKADPATAIRDLPLITGRHAAPDWSAEAGAAALAESPVDCLPVLDKDRRVVGLVTARDAERYLVAEIERDTNRAVGIVGEEVTDEYFERSIWSDFRRRIPWILGLAVAGLAAGYVVHIYENALDALVILALYMPMVADTGGNVGTQSASLVTRAISFGEVGVRDALRVLWREARIAILVAAALFTFAFLKVLLISNAGDVPAGLTLSGIGFAIAVALAAQVISATLIGAMLPLAAVAARQDPAVVSGPALTTIVDLTGLILYFGITTHLLGIV